MSTTTTAPTLTGKTPEGRHFTLQLPTPDRPTAHLTWEATDEIGPIGIPVKHPGDLYYALTRGLPFRQFLKA